MSEISKILKIAREASDAILNIYENEEDFEVEHKADDSPLTKADKASHEIISEGLQKITPTIPILSEESAEIEYSERRKWNEFWLVDPLDGTKEFIKRNGEFTVNIAKIKSGESVLGIIYIPVQKLIYFAEKGKGAYVLHWSPEFEDMEAEEIREKARKLDCEDNNEFENIKVVASRSHLSEETREYVEQLKSEYSNVELVSAGSSLKFTLVAEGKAQVYPRFAPTMEWDTAAGQCIAEEAGASVINKETGEKLVYNKENLLNPYFIVESRKEQRKEFV